MRSSQPWLLWPLQLQGLLWGWSVREEVSRADSQGEGTGASGHCSQRKFPKQLVSRSTNICSCLIVARGCEGDKDTIPTLGVQGLVKMSHTQKPQAGSHGSAQWSRTGLPTPKTPRSGAGGTAPHCPGPGCVSRAQASGLLLGRAVRWALLLSGAQLNWHLVTQSRRVLGITETSDNN